jgi:predicted GNAT family N-acyltransferase
MPLRLHNAAELTVDETAALGELRIAVYPPDFVANWPGRSIEWATPQWRLIDWDEHCRALCHVGIFLREGEVAGKPVTIGGIGGVMTHPNARRQGVASRAIGRSIEFMMEQRADFALLVCEQKLVPFYQRLGWKRHGDKLMVTQHGEKSEFAFNLPMIHSVSAEGPIGGVIDLQGPPW